MASSLAPAPGMPTNTSLDLSPHDDQMQAHNSLIRASQETRYRALFGASAQQAASIGLGTAMTFGLGRSVGQEASGQIGNFGKSGAADSATEVALQFARAALGHGGASLGGGLFNTATPYVAAALANLIPLKFAPNDACELVPLKKIDLMNALVPGAGDALLAECSSLQGAAARLDSDSSIKAGEWAFDAANAARGAGLANDVLHPAAAVGVGTLVSALGGVGTGLGMAYQQATATVQVPRLAELEQAVQAAGSDPQRGAKLLELLTSHHSDSLNLFKVVKPPVSTAQAYRNAFRNSPLRAPKPSESPDAGRSMVQHASAVAQTVANVTAAVLDRSLELSKATAATSAMTAVTKIAMQGGADKNGDRIIAAVGLATAIHVAVGPWFQKVGAIASRDAARLQRNQAAADEAHVSQQATT